MMVSLQRLLIAFLGLPILGFYMLLQIKEELLRVQEGPFFGCFAVFHERIKLTLSN